MELFSSGNRSIPPNTSGENSFMGCVRSYEKALLILIAFIAVAITAFSLGVEKGKRVAQVFPAPAIAVKQPTATLVQGPPAVKPQQTAVRESTAVRPVISQTAPVQPEAVMPAEQAAANASSLSGYTIQLASFKSNTAAQKQADMLRKRGLNPLLMTKGSYVVLCVGNFADRQSAAPLLSELRKLYRDCLVRRL